MPYCIKCGIKLPDVEEAKFCPYCGATLTSQLDYIKPELVAFKARKEAMVTTLKTRLIVMTVVMVLCFAVTSAGVLTKMDSSEVNSMVQEQEKIQDMVKYAGVQVIFGINLVNCLISFIPVYGPFYGSLVLYTTGRGIAAIGLTAKINPMLLLVSLFAFPHTWMEFICCSVAISESLWLIYVVAKHGFRGFRNEITSASKAIAIIAIILLLAAFLEVLLISFAVA